MARIRTDAQRLADRQERARAVAKAILEGEPERRPYVATTGMDLDMARGIPILARGVGGAVRGSVPHIDGVQGGRYASGRGAPARS